MKIFIIIVNYSRQEETVACIDSVKRLENKNWELEIVVVDNAPKKDKVTLIKKKFPEIHLVINEDNTGFAQGNNLGISFALERNADYVILLNDDTAIDSKSLIYLIKAAEKFQDVGIVSPKIYFTSGYEYHKDRYKKNDLGRVVWYAGGKIDWYNVLGIHEGLDEVDKKQFEEMKQVEFISGCCMLIKKKVFEKIGLLDEHYFMYLEDMDFCVRAKKAGFKLLFVPQAIVWHKNLGTDKKSSNSRQAYYYTRNRLLFGFKFTSLRTKFALFRESLKTIYKGSYWQKRGALDFYLGKFGEGSYPTWGK